ncbi:MAG: AAA family ATPase [Chloroflexi bacterium]|nr:AAA family ATPase [Chloroflexota bacterium]
MYRSFSIKNFRCFDELTVEGMGRINLIAGKNNVGKTALLEALWVHSGEVNPNLAVRVEAFRGLEQQTLEHFLESLFKGFDRNLAIEISSTGDWEESPFYQKIYFQDRSSFEIPLTELENDQLALFQNSSIGIRTSHVVVMEYSDGLGQTTVTKGRLVARHMGPVQDVGLEVAYETGQPLQDLATSIFLASRRASVGLEDVNRYSELEVNGEAEGVLEILQTVEPELRRITVVSARQAPSIYADVGAGRLIPIQLMGDGMSRILSLALAIASAPEGTVLVDEIENGIHHSVMEKVWKAIGAFARSYDVQLFATTHSYECIGAAYRAFEADEEDELRLFRIQRNTDGQYKAVTYDRERLGGVLELRMEFI